MINSRIVRTSTTDPLRIAEIAARQGAIGVTFCPGRNDDYASGGAWRRDLDADLRVIVNWGARALVTLIELHEFDLLGVKALGAKAVEHGLAWHHLPIPDVQPPDERFEEGWQRVGPVLRGQLQQGERIVVHCRGGIGRAGTVAARLLVELGVRPRDAISRVRAARPGAIETRAQEAHVLACSPIETHLEGG